MNLKSRHLSLGVSALLFIIAAFTAACLIAGIVTGFAPDQSNFLCRFGTMLYSVYGFTSCLIPAFFFVAAYFCIDDKWSLQRIVCLGISFIPFFTLAIAENVSRKVYVEDVSPIAITKIVILMAIAILLVAMEYLVAMVLSTSSLKKDIMPRVIKCKTLIIEKAILLKSRFYKGGPKVIFPAAEQARTSGNDDSENSGEEPPAEAPDVDMESADTVVAEGEGDVEDEPLTEEELEIERQIESGIDAAVDSMFEDEAEKNEVSESESPSDTMQLPSVHEVFEQMENDVNEENLDTEEEFIEEDDTIVSGEMYVSGSDSEETVEQDAADVEETQNNESDDFDASDEEADDDFAFSEDDDDSDAEIAEDIRDDISEDLSDTIGDDSSDSIDEESEAEPETASIADMPRAVQSDGTPIPLPEKRRSRGIYAVSTDLLTSYGDNHYWVIDEETEQAAVSLTETLSEFGIKAEVTEIVKGPVVTMFEMLPAPGVKLSKIVALQDNIALRLAASSVRIVAPIPGKNAVGIEIPNAKRAIVSFKECIEQDLGEWEKMAVPVVLGKDIEGKIQLMDLVRTPHLLIAGSTGAGKSVCVNSMLMSILYKRSPDQVKLILIDPKIVELKLYNDIPHLLTPVITEPKKAMQALQYCLCEMERRYALLDGMGVRDISSYNKRIVERRIAAEKIPYLIVVIDEFADLMATTGKQLETVVARLCAMSRAVGIHLVLATQRPSIDVITGLIKANIPSRIAFMVASKTDSRIIIDQVGAEKLLGKGDMLYASSTDPFPVRIQGTFVSDQEVEGVVDCVKQWGEPEYIDDEIFIPDDDDEETPDVMLDAGGEDPLYDKALDIVVQAGKASASYIQRRLKIGYNRAARLVEEMEERGIVGPANGSKPREIIHMP